MRQFYIAAIATLTTASSVFGHGVQIQITFNPTTGKIETREVIHTGARPAAIEDLKRVYVMPLLNSSLPAGNGWYTRPDDSRDIFNVPLYPTGPGLTYQYEDQLTGSGWSWTGSATLPNLAGTNFGYQITDGFKLWDGSGFVDPGAEQLQIFRGEGTAAVGINAITSDSGPYATMALSTINAAAPSPNAHSSVGFRLLGDGATSTAIGDDGIYLLSLQLTSTAPGVAASDPFYLVLTKNQSLDSALTAADSLGFSSNLIQVVPEPAALSLLGAGALLTLRRKLR